MNQIEILRQLLTAVLSRDEILALYQDVEGWLHPDEAYTLFLTAMHGPGSGAIVEIGSYMGKSTCFLAHGSKIAGRGPVVAIDTFGGSPEHQPGKKYQSAVLAEHGTTFTKFTENLTKAQLLDWVEPIRASSAGAGPTWTRPIRLLFIYGDHSYEGVKRDFELFSPHVERDGLILFHDVGNQDWPGVLQFFNELDTRLWQPLLRVQTLTGIARANAFT